MGKVGFDDIIHQLVQFGHFGVRRQNLQAADTKPRGGQTQNHLKQSMGHFAVETRAERTIYYKRQIGNGLKLFLS